MDARARNAAAAVTSSSGHTKSMGARQSSARTVSPSMPRALSKLDLLRPRTTEERVKEMHVEVKATAENKPAVYRMIAADGEVVYVGKAKSLRTRLMSYFRGVYPDDKGARIL